MRLLFIGLMAVTVILIVGGLALAQTPQVDQYGNVLGGGIGPTADQDGLDDGLFGSFRSQLPGTGIAIALLAGSTIAGIGAGAQLLRKNRKR